MSEPHSYNIEWLKKHALFSCRNDSCREEQSFHYTELAIHHDGGLICENCWNEESNFDDPTFNDLQEFDPFSKLIEAKP